MNLKKKDKRLGDSHVLFRFIGSITIFCGFLIAITAFTADATSQTWYVVLTMFFSACVISSGVIVFITKRFEKTK